MGTCHVDRRLPCPSETYLKTITVSAIHPGAGFLPEGIGLYLSDVYIAPPLSLQPYDWHRALWQLFPDRPDESRRFLFRVEQELTGGGVLLVMQSAIKPIAESGHCRCLSIVPQPTTLRVGEKYGFRLRANPVQRKKDPAGSKILRKGQEYDRSIRVPVKGKDNQRQWLTSKLKRMGAELLSVQSYYEAPLSFTKYREQRRGKVQPVLFEGMLLVEDADLLTTAVMHGIGPAKSFGMGLLTLQPEGLNTALYKGKVA